MLSQQTVLEPAQVKYAAEPTQVKTVLEPMTVLTRVRSNVLGPIKTIYSGGPAGAYSTTPELLTGFKEAAL